MSTTEKASNTRTSRLLANRSTEVSRDESPPTVVESSSGVDATSSPAPRRRRRRERPKPMEVTVRPTTNSYQSSEGYARTESECRLNSSHTQCTQSDSSQSLDLDSQQFDNSEIFFNTDQQVISCSSEILPAENTDTDNHYEVNLSSGDFAPVLVYSSSIDDNVYGEGGEEVFEFVASVDNVSSTSYEDTRTVSDFSDPGYFTPPT